MGVQSSGNPIACPICGQRMTYSGDADYYDQSSRYRTPVYHCGSCDVLYRPLDHRRLVSHYYAATYVQDKNEEDLLRSRIGFFRWILSLVRSCGFSQVAGEPRPLTLLDFGSAYGHLLRLAEEQGYRAVGIELNEDLVKSCRQKGLVVLRGFEEFSEKVDAITALDSFYCVADPRELMAKIRDRLRPDGVFVARLTNRNLYAKFRSIFVRKGDWSAIGDATVSYSMKGIRRLLALSGFRIEKVIPDCGRGKKLAARKRLSYLSTYLLTLLTLQTRILTPGIIVIARPAGGPSNNA